MAHRPYETAAATVGSGRMSRQHLRLNQRRWTLVRQQVLDRDGWRCRQCGRAGRLKVDHIEALEDGGDPWAPENLQALCCPCHIQKTAAENRARLPRQPEVEAWHHLVDEALSTSPESDSSPSSIIGP